jgi:hypothetical protein
MIIVPAVWRSGTFQCTDCDARFVVWLDRLAPLAIKVGDHTKETCPRCRQPRWFRLVGIVDVPVPDRLPPIPTSHFE